MEHSSPPMLFDRALLRKRRDRHAVALAANDFLYREAAERMADSLAFITRPFPRIVELGAQSPHLRSLLESRPGTEHYIACDLSPKILHPQQGPRIVADEETLPFAENSVDAVLSIFSLYTVNDLPGTLAQIHRMLKPDGLFMAILPGGETLRELRNTLATAETNLTGGMHARIAPFIDVRDAGALLGRAKFALPVADSELLTITYPNLFALMAELKTTGQSSLLTTRPKRFTSKSLFFEAVIHYATTHPDGEGGIKATMELVTLTGWKPSINQQQPAKRGSGTVSLTRALQ